MWFAMMSMHRVTVVSITEACMADYLQHTQTKSDHAWNMKTYLICDMFKRSFRLSHPPPPPPQSKTGMCAHPAYIYCTPLRNMGTDSSICEESLSVSVNISHTISEIQERDCHSARAYHISERLPLEARPVILGELLWRRVMSIGNEDGVAGY